MTGLPTPRAAACAVALVLALGAAGCGSDDDEEGAAARATTSEFRTQARAATAAVSAVGEKLGTAMRTAPQQTDSALAVTFAGLADEAREAVADLQALDPPAAQRSKVGALVAALGTAARDLDAIAVAARGNDPAAARSATETLVEDSPAVQAANRALKAAVGVEEPQPQPADPPATQPDRAASPTY